MRTLLATQKFGSNEPPPYDDTGWTLDLLRHVVVRPVADSSVLAQGMTPLDADAVATGTVSGDGSTLVVRNTGDWRAAALPWKISGARFAVADTTFSVGDQQFPAGTFIVEGATSKSVAALGLKCDSGQSIRETPRHQSATHRVDAHVDRDAERGVGAISPSSKWASPIRRSATRA